MHVNLICFLKDFFSFYSDEVARPGVVAVTSRGESGNIYSRKQTHQTFIFYFCERLLRSKKFYNGSRNQ